MGPRLRVLIIEDSEVDAALVVRELGRAGYELALTRVDTAESFRAALDREPWDVIIADYAVPGLPAPAALTLVQQRGLDIPFIVISGTIGEEIAVQIMKAGAHDYVMKDRLTRLPAAVERELREAVVRREHRRTEDERARLIAILEATPDLVGIADAQGRALYLNRGGRKMLGFGEDEDIRGLSIAEYHPPRARELILNEAIPAAIRQGVWSGEAVLLSRDGREIPVSQVILAHKTAGGTAEYLSTIARDLTDRKRAEEQIQHQLESLTALYTSAQKLSQSLDLTQLADYVTGTCVRAFGVRLAWLGHAEPDGSMRTLSVTSSGRVFPAGLAVRWDDSPQGQSPAGRALRAGFPVVIHDLEADPAWAAATPAAALEEGLRCGAALPLISRDRPFGVLLLYSDQPDFFTPARVEFFQAFAHLTSAALENARLFDETRRRVDQLQALRTIDMAITASMDLRVTLSILLDQVTSVLEADAAAVLLLDPHAHVLEWIVGRGFKTRAVERSRLRLGEGLAGRAALERRTVSIPDLREAGSEFVRASLLAEEGFVSYTAVPLLSKGQVKGVLEIFDRVPRGFDSERLTFLETVAGQAAIAIDNAAIFSELQRTNADLVLAYDTTLEGWVRALDLRDKETEGHTQRVTELTVRLGRAMGMSDAELVHVRRGALLHDIGKMGIPDSILLKPGPLTDEEWAIMKQHPVYAYELLSPISFLRPALDIPYCHHEKWDGTGYPRGLKGEQIPLAARIFAVVDVWDALRSDRPYRKAWTDEQARRYIREQAGKHFDPRVVDVFLRLVQ